MSRNKYPGKIGHYTGPGEPLTDVIIGMHDRGLQFAPWNFAHVSTYDIHNTGMTYTAAEWTQTLENSGTIAMGTSGILFTTGAASGNNSSHQLIRDVVPNTGRRFGVFMRCSFGDLPNTGIYIGFCGTDTDYFSTEPTQQVGFFKDKGGTSDFVGRCKDGVTGSNTSTLLASGVVNTMYDFSILYDGPNAAVFFGVKPISRGWLATDFTKKTTNLPSATVRLSAYIENDTENAANTMIVQKCLFWAEGV